jgi:hypothetical protein
MLIGPRTNNAEGGNVFLIGQGVLLDDYRQLPSLNDEGVKLGHDKWHIAFQGLLQQVANRVGDDAPPEETVAFSFDWKQKRGAAQFLFDYTKEDRRLKSWRRRLGTLTFGHKEFDVPDSIPLLQIADIAAFETRKALANPITHPHFPERKSLARLKRADRVWSISFLDEPVLRAIYEMKRGELGLPNNAKEVTEKLNQQRPDGWQYRPKLRDDAK